MRFPINLKILKIPSYERNNLGMKKFYTKPKKNFPKISGYAKMEVTFNFKGEKNVKSK